MNKLCIVWLLFAATNTYGQYLENYEKLALASFHSKDYETALLYSERVLEIDPGNVPSLYMAGESALMLDELEKAEAHLEKIPDGAKIGYYSMADYRLGMVKYELAKEDEAKVFYTKYLSHHNQENDHYAYLAEQALRDLEAGIKSGKRHLAETERLGDNINSPLSDMAPLRYADKLYFTAIDETNVVPKNKRGKKMVKHPVSRIYEAQFDRPARPSVINPKRATLNASNVALTPDAKRIYYTLCKDNDYLSQEKCEIWYRERTYEGTWSAATRLPDHINVRGHSATQPSVGYDKQLKSYVLYFASERPGGKGGMDIWVSQLDWKGETFGEPENLPINTAGNEVTPFYHQSSQTFFFSSDGPSSQGGLDIFRCKRDEQGNWATAESLGSLVNSDFDDLYYSFHTSTRNAYFVSNRPGSICNEKKGRSLDCTDIYQARIFVDLELEFLSFLDKSKIKDVQVEIVEVGSGATGSFVSPPNRNKLRARLDPGRKYRVTVFAQGYDEFSFDLNTKDISYVATIEKEVLLGNGLAQP